MWTDTRRLVARRPPASRQSRTAWLHVTTFAVCSAVCCSGCATSSKWVEVRTTPRNPLAGTLDLVSPGGPKPTPRTMQLLRRYDLAGDLDADRAALLARLEEVQRREPDREHEYAMAEIAYITASQAEKLHRSRALEFYGTALIHAYRYLFDYAEALPTNPYDPQFRGASDLYNQSLEGMLRIVQHDGAVRPGLRRSVKTASHTCSFDVTFSSTGWHEQDVDQLYFVSDYKVNGLRNHYHTYGLGVPLIAMRQSHAGASAAERYYPPNVCFPVTAFLRVETPGDAHAGFTQATIPISIQRTSHGVAPHVVDPSAPNLVLELHDPLDRTSIEVAGRNIPLEADLSTPLAYFLNQPQFQDKHLSNLGLLHPGDARDIQGLYMLEPFNPEKMPVVMVHGLWSSPITWMEMYNDLRSDPLIRQRYQFWFYFYATGQPFWISAAQMREDLAVMRRELDPGRSYPALDQTVLIGHSMGGLVSKLQTVESANAFWQTMSEHEFAELKADPEAVRSLATTYFFRPNPSIRRVVTLGTPHRGSEFSNDVTRWLGEKLIALPQRMIDGRNQLLANNRGYFRRGAPLRIKTSIASLAPDSPLLPVLLASEPGPWVGYHNVVGLDPEPGWQRYFVGEGDGVVSLGSARLDDMKQLRSQIVVPADHISVHRHPQSILEVRRVLFEQLAELENFPGNYRTAVATEASTPTASDRTSLDQTAIGPPRLR